MTPTPGKITLTIAAHGRTGTVEMPDDSTIGELVEGFAALAQLIGFHQNIVNHALSEYSE